MRLASSENDHSLHPFIGALGPSEPYCFLRFFRLKREIVMARNAQIGYLASWIYIAYAWTIGHGGRTHVATEYRIQLKLQGQPKLIFNNGTMILIGLYDSSLDPQAERFRTGDAVCQRSIRQCGPIYRRRLQ